MKRLPKSPQHRAKLSAAMKGRPKTPEHRAKISEAMKGRPKSPETIAKMTAARRARPHGLTDAQIEFETLRRNRRIAAERTRERMRQWNRDRRAARKLGDPDVLHDVKKSGGWHSKRRYRGFPGVSDGYSKPLGYKVIWSQWPYVRLAAVPQKRKKSHGLTFS